MPTYSYICEKGHEFDFYQSIKDKPLKKCKKAGCKAKVKRVINFDGGIIFKGTWTPKFYK